MTFIAECVALCEAVTFMGRLLRWLRGFHLGRREKEILSRAAGGGLVQLVPFDGQLAVVADSHEFAAQGDALERAEYRAALKRLCSLGMLEVEDRQGVFRLTPPAHRRGRKLAAKGWASRLATHS
jgi:hypothetical protein